MKIWIIYIIATIAILFIFPPIGAVALALSPVVIVTAIITRNKKQKKSQEP